VVSGAAGGGGTLEAADAQRVLHFVGLGGGVEGVGHVTLDGGGAVGVGSPAAAAADGFVVRPPFPAQCDGAHGAATGGGDLVGQGFGQSAEDDVDDALAGLGVAGDDGGGELRVNHRPRTRDHLDVAEAPAVERNVLFQQTGEAIINRGAGDGGGTVDAAGDLLFAAAQTDGGARAGDGDDGAEGDRPVAGAVIV